MKVRSKTWLVLMLLLVFQIMINIYYIWIDTHLLGRIGGIVSFLAMLVGFFGSFVLLGMLCAVNGCYIAAIVFKLLEAIFVLAGFASSAEEALLVIYFAESLDAISLLLTLVGTAVITKNIPIKIIGFLLSPVTTFCTFMFLGFYSMAQDEKQACMDALFAVDPNSMWDNALQTVNYVDLGMKYASGNYQDMGGMVFDALYPNVRALFLDWLETLLYMVEMRVGMEVSKIVSYIFIFVAAILLIKVGNQIAREKKLKNQTKMNQQQV